MLFSNWEVICHISSSYTTLCSMGFLWKTNFTWA